MKKELSVKARLIIGTISLVITGIFTSCLLIKYQKDWIILLAMIIFAILFKFRQETLFSLATFL